MVDDIKKIIKDTAKATAKEVRHEFDIVIEDLERGTLKAIREELGTHTKQIRELQKDVGSLKKDIGEMKNDVTVIKLAVQGTEGERQL